MHLARKVHSYSWPTENIFYENNARPSDRIAFSQPGGRTPFQLSNAASYKEELASQ